MYRCFDAYNEWLAQWCAQGRGRLNGVAILPTVYQPEATADYIDHLKDLGFRTMMLPNFPRGVDYSSPDMAPMWTRAPFRSSGIACDVDRSAPALPPNGLGRARFPAKPEQKAGLSVETGLGPTFRSTL